MKNKLLPDFKTIGEREAFWYQVCQEYIASGLTSVEFCIKRKISTTSISRWTKYFKKHPAPSQPYIQLNSSKHTQKATAHNKSKPKAAFLPVTVATPTNELSLAKQPKESIEPLPQKLPLAELLFPNGIKLIFNQEFNVNLLSQLMAIGR